MQYELLTHRGMQPNDRMPLMTLLYVYSKYAKERKEAESRPKTKGTLTSK